MWLETGSVICIVFHKRSVCKEVIIGRQVEEIKSLTTEALKQKRCLSLKRNTSMAKYLLQKLNRGPKIGSLSTQLANWDNVNKNETSVKIKGKCKYHLKYLFKSPEEQKRSQFIAQILSCLYEIKTSSNAASWGSNKVNKFVWNKKRTQDSQCTRHWVNTVNTDVIDRRIRSASEDAGFFSYLHNIFEVSSYWLGDQTKATEWKRPKTLIILFFQCKQTHLTRGFYTERIFVVK